MRRTVENTMSCRNSSFRNTQDVLNVLNASQVKNQSYCATKHNLQARAWNLMNGKVVFQYLEEPIGSRFLAGVRFFSDSVFCTGPGALDPISAFQFERVGSRSGYEE